MPDFNINIGLSTIKRESKPKQDVERQLLRNGWEETASLADDRVSYFENSGISVTVVEGPFGTVVVPSGPVRGPIFGKNVQLFSRKSALAMGAGGGSKKDRDNKDNAEQVRGSRRSGKMMV